MAEELLTSLQQRFEQAERILITSHVRPDGDAVSSVLALGLALQENGKDVIMALSDGVPAALKFLPRSKQIIKKPEGEFDLIVVVDCGSLDRVGNVLNGHNKVDVNIDHHVSNPKFGEINLVEGDAVSTTEIMAKHFPALGLPITKQVASALLVGILTDSQGFKTINTRPEALRIAANLYEMGANFPVLYYDALSKRTYESAGYWGAGLSNMQRDGKLVWTYLSLADRKAAQYPGRDDADLINIMSEIDDTEVAVIFIEQESGSVKVSWRTRSKIDVSRIAAKFGGGGHVAAAGAMIRGELQEVQEKVIQMTKSMTDI